MVIKKAEPLRLRLRRLQSKLRSAGLDGAIMAPGPNLRYYTGSRSQLFERPFLFFVPDDGTSQLLVPGFEAGPFRRNNSSDLEVIEWNDSPGPSEAFRRIQLTGRWGCEGSVPFGYVSRFLKRERLNLVNGDEVLQSIREVKSPEEIAYLNKAASILVKSFLNVLDGKLKAGVREQELARRLTDEVLSNGAESCEFCNVQSGPRAAEPHSEASSRRLERGESLIIDAGCTYMGYNADITRTFVVGKDEEVERVYNSVLEAQAKGIRAIRPGEETGAIDAAARQPLERAGLGRYFTHRTGHGLGLEIHEAPFLVGGTTQRLREGMALTVEPGVYIPQKLGVRIEDDVVVSRRGRDVITARLPKEYGWWH